MPTLQSNGCLCSLPCVSPISWAAALNLTTLLDAALPGWFNQASLLLSNDCLCCMRSICAVALYQYHNSSVSTIISCGQAKHWHPSVNLLEIMRREGSLPSVIDCSAAISACVKGRQWQSALGLLLRTRNHHVRNTISYNAGIGACDKGVNRQRAVGLLEAMQSDGSVPNATTYGAAIGSCEKTRQWLQALCLPNAMMSDDFFPNVINYSDAMRACEKGRQWQKALNILLGHA